MNTCDTNKFQVAIAACLAHAKAELFRSTGEVADAMGANREVVYKWTQTARLPLVEVANFERACGANHVTRALAADGGYVLVQEPTHQGVAALDFARAQWQVAKAMYDASAACIDPGQAGQAMHSLTQAMERMAALREQFAKAAK